MSWLALGDQPAEPDRAAQDEELLARVDEPQEQRRVRLLTDGQHELEVRARPWKT